MANVQQQGYEKRVEQATFGGQGHLRVSAVPATGNKSIIGKRLIDCTAGELGVAGDYYCDFYCSGLSAVNVHLKATFASSTVVSDVYTTYADGVTSYQGFSSDGSLTTTVLQTATLAATVGEQVVRVKLTLGATPVAVFTQAEFNGPR
jgi:hypothetical protein